MIFDIMPKNQKPLPFRLRSSNMKSVKIAVSKDLKRLVRLEIKKERKVQGKIITMEQFVLDTLRSAFERDYIVDLPDVKYYENTGIYIATWIPEREHDYLQELAIEWGVSARCAAYRVFQHEFLGGVDEWQDVQHSI